MNTSTNEHRSPSIVGRLVAFAELLRREQFGTTPSETLDAAQVVMSIDISNVDDFHRALKAALVKRSENYDKFDEIFRAFWLTKLPTSTKENPLGRISIPGRNIERSLQIPDLPSNQQGRGRITAGSMFNSAASNPNDADKMLGIYSPLEATSRKSFNDLNIASDRALLKRGVRSFAKVTATRPGRRNVPLHGGEELDFRKTFRNSLKTSGHLTEIERSQRKISRSSPVILCDISGSMDSYSSRVLKLVYHFSNTVRGSEIFGFSTRIVSMNRYLRGKSLEEASRLVSEKIDVWSSGTRIGAALGDLLFNHSGILRSSTVFIVISDGWELGDLEILRSRLNEIHRRVARIVWLNPQADSPDYVPLAEGMKSSLPYIDVFCGLDIFSDRTKFRHVFGPSVILAREIRTIR